MEKLTQLFEEYINKCIFETEKSLSLSLDEFDIFYKSIENRERLLQIINQISLQVDWLQVNLDKRNELNQKIELMKKLDNELLTKLQEFKSSLKKEIETTFRQKENIKGYNLSQVK
jgi:hypothetical protein